VEIHGGPFDEDSTDKLDYDVDEAREDPWELIDENIRFRDNRSGEISKYVVVDYINSLMRGDYFVLGDGQGRRHNVTRRNCKKAALISFCRLYY